MQSEAEAAKAFSNIELKIIDVKRKREKKI
jgi:hypothetical protein